MLRPRKELEMVNAPEDLDFTVAVMGRALQVVLCFRQVCIFQKESIDGSMKTGWIFKRVDKNGVIHLFRDY